MKMSLTFVPGVPVYNDSLLVWMMALRLIGSKPLSEPFMTQVFDALWRHCHKEVSILLNHFHHPRRCTKIADC